MIERRNILDLIGKHSRKYHSCILTCYTLDFSFFEQRVLPLLRTTNIKNVNVLTDGHSLELAQEATTGKEFRYNKTYNFQPIYATGVFHPKIMLLTGGRHGLLIIGSGNITSSGLSTNDEIWGAFHLDSVDNENAPLFGAVWKYLQPYLNTALGFLPQKIDWMRKYSPWLDNLPVTTDWINLESLGIELRFLGNIDEGSIFNQLIAQVPNREVEELSVISPYYDRSGHLIKQLKEHFRPITMRCIVDTNSGLLPTDLDEITSSQIRFHSWADCKRDFDDNYHRLHAKAIHFKLKAEECLLLGSANTTVAAMGSGDAPAANAEAVILLKRTLGAETWFQELKVHIPERTIVLKHYSSSRQGDGALPRMKYQYKVLYAELRANELTIYLDKACSDQPQVAIVDRADGPVTSSIKEIIGKTIVVQVSDSDAVFKLTLFNDGQRISNYCLVHRLEALLRCNPDPNQEKLDAMLEQDFANGEGITDLLQFVDYDWADEGSETPAKHYNHTGTVVRKLGDDEKTKEYEVLDADEFNKASSESLLKQSGELSNATIKIAEFLNHYASGLLGEEEDFQESEEQRLLEDREQRGAGDEAIKSGLKATDGSKEKAAMMKYFEKLDDIYRARLDNFFTSQAITEAPKTPITIRSLSAILIALHLIQLKHGSRFNVLTKEKDEDGQSVFKEESYITSGIVGDSTHSLKGFLLNVLGKFLLLLCAGSKVYEYEILNQKHNEKQKQFLIRAIWLILNTTWKNSEIIHRDLLLLNCLYFSLGTKMLKAEIVSEILTSIPNQKLGANAERMHFEHQFTGFKEELLPCYLDWLNRFADKEKGRDRLIYHTSELGFGNIIFNSKLGFSAVIKVSPASSGFYIDLMRAGFPFVEGEAAMKGVQLGAKSIVYRGNEVV